MAEGKKSFVLYADLKPTIKKLVENDRINNTNNAGELFLHIFEYVTDCNPEAINFIVDVSFEPIKQQLKRDLIKFEEVKEKRSVAGKASSEARKNAKQTSTNSTHVESVEQTSTNSTVSVNDNVNVNDSVINNKTDSKESYFDLFWSKYPSKVAKSKVKTKFLKLKDSEITKILETIDKFVAYKPFQGYTHPNPYTYLNQKRWEDEIQEPKKGGWENSNDPNYFKHLDDLPNKMIEQFKLYGINGYEKES